MGNLVDQSSTVICAHGARAMATAPNPRVKVGGQPTVLLSTPWTVAGCPMQLPTGPPCLTGQWLVGTVRVTSGGQPLVIQGGSAVCAPSGGPLTVVVAQPRVVAT